MSAVKGTARLLVMAGSAKPSPAIGQALGPLGVNMMEFCKQFNARTESFKETALMRVKLEAREDRTFNFDVLPPPTTWYLKRVTGVTKGSAMPGKQPVGKVSVRALYEIAVAKQELDPALATVPTEGLVRSIAATAKSMGLSLRR